MVVKERLIDEFLELVSISSPSRREGKIAGVLKDKLKSLGFTVHVDSAGERIGGETGNIVAILAKQELKDINSAGALLLSAHMDTVEPCEEVKPQLTDGIISSSGDTVLGADAKAGIAAILEAVRVVQEEGLPHPPLVVVISVAEEQGLMGISHLDAALVKAKWGVVLDCGGPVGEIVIRGPAHSRIRAKIKGKAAHAGFQPEDGISAIQIASEAVRRMKLGRIDGDTTANIGMINGGRATNIIPDQVTIEGEARSLFFEKLTVQIELMKRAFEEAAARFGGSVEVELKMSYPVIDIEENAAVVQLVKSAGDAAGLALKTVATGGGSDANIFNAMGIPTVNLSTGMEKVHTTGEYIRVDELVKLSRLVINIIKKAAEQV